MSKGLVYILTNPCLDGWVKIGMTERNDIERRLQELNSPTTFRYHIVVMLFMKWKIHSKLKKGYIALLIELMIRYTQENN